MQSCENIKKKTLQDKCYPLAVTVIVKIMNLLFTFKAQLGKTKVLLCSGAAPIPAWVTCLFLFMGQENRHFDLPVNSLSKSTVLDWYS